MSATIHVAAPEPVYDALSQINAEGEPLVKTCQLVMGDGTQKVNFKNGRAKVPHSLAELVSKHPQIDVIGYEGGTLTEVAAPAAPDTDARDQLLAQQAAELAQLRAQLVAQAQAGEKAGIELPADGVERTVELDGGSITSSVTVTPAPEDPDVSEQVRLAMEHLAAEGEDVPEPQVAKSTEGFEATTQDGQARCQAAKSDGGQCSNPSVEGDACGLPKHKEQLAS